MTTFTNIIMHKEVSKADLSYRSADFVVSIFLNKYKLNGVY